MVEAQTLKLDFMVKKWQNQKIISGILIYALCRFPVGRIDTLKAKTKKMDRNPPFTTQEHDLLNLPKYTLVQYTVHVAPYRYQTT